ncbi:hypothetical protein CsSME_00007874 [Camellia sinensis var. sinensis]
MGTQAEIDVRNEFQYPREMQKTIEDGIARGNTFKLISYDRSCRVFEVQTSFRHGRGRNTEIVRMNQPTCSCGKYEIRHYPCSHMLVVMSECGDNPFEKSPGNSEFTDLPYSKHALILSVYADGLSSHVTWFGKRHFLMPKYYQVQGGSYMEPSDNQTRYGLSDAARLKWPALFIEQVQLETLSWENQLKVPKAHSVEIQKEDSNNVDRLCERPQPLAVAFVFLTYSVVLFTSHPSLLFVELHSLLIWLNLGKASLFGFPLPAINNPLPTTGVLNHHTTTEHKQRKKERSCLWLGGTLKRELKPLSTSSIPSLNTIIRLTNPQNK